MLAAEHRRHNERQIERRAKSARRSLAFTQPKASALKLHHPDVAQSKSKSKTPEPRRSRVLGWPISNGASPVASALGIRLGATPRGLHQPNMASPARLSKQDISTLLGIGHFYFALTGVKLGSSLGSAELWWNWVEHASRNGQHLLVSIPPPGLCRTSVCNWRGCKNVSRTLDSPRDISKAIRVAATVTGSG